MRLGAAWHAHRRFGVYRVADGGEFAQHRARIAVLEQRTMVSSPDALHQSVDVGVEPHRYSLVQNEGACLLVHERAAAGGDHLRFPVAQPGDDPPLAVADMRLAELLEAFADGAARPRLYPLLGLEERQPQPPGTAAAKTGSS